jgi:KilA-N domain
MEKQAKIQVQETEIRLYVVAENDFFSITDIAKRFNADSPADVIANWMRNKDTVEFLGTWEMLNNLDFKLVEFEEFKRFAVKTANLSNSKPVVLIC